MSGCACGQQRDAAALRYRGIASAAPARSSPSCPSPMPRRTALTCGLAEVPVDQRGSRSGLLEGLRQRARQRRHPLLAPRR